MGALRWRTKVLFLHEDILLFQHNLLKRLLFPSNCLCPFVKNQLTINMRVCFSIPLFCGSCPVTLGPSGPWPRVKAGVRISRSTSERTPCPTWGGKPGMQSAPTRSAWPAAALPAAVTAVCCLSRGPALPRCHTGPAHPRDGSGGGAIRHVTHQPWVGGVSQPKPFLDQVCVLPERFHLLYLTGALPCP